MNTKELFNIRLKQKVKNLSIFILVHLVICLLFTPGAIITSNEFFLFLQFYLLIWGIVILLAYLFCILRQYSLKPASKVIFTILDFLFKFVLIASIPLYFFIVGLGQR